MLSGATYRQLVATTPHARQRVLMHHLSYRQQRRKRLAAAFHPVTGHSAARQLCTQDTTGIHDYYHRTANRKLGSGNGRTQIKLASGFPRLKSVLRVFFSASTLLAG